MRNRHSYLAVQPASSVARHCLLILPVLLAAMPVCSPGAESDTGKIEEIVVTARKLSEELFRVPMSLSTLSGDLLQDTRLDNLYDMQYDVPGLVVTSMGLWGAKVAIRGVSDDGGSSPTVATSLDGVALEQAGAALTRLFDVDRIEVLKGPQGTLYGRNSTGGTINVISRVPENELGAAFEVSRGSFDTTRIQGFVNVPAGDVTVRFAAIASEGDGFIHNTVDKRRFAEEDYDGVRISLRLAPSDALTIDLRAQRVRDDGGSAELWLPRIDNLVDPKNIYLTTVTEDEPFLATTDEVGSITVDYLARRFMFQSISAYSSSLTRNLDDCGVVVGLESCTRGARPADYLQRSQEFHLSALPGTTNPWLVGVYYLDGESFTRFFNYVPLRLPLPINDYTATGDRQAWAVYGNLTRKLGPRWSALVGLRMSRETARWSSYGTGINDSPTPVARRGAWDNSSWRLGLQYSPSEQTLLYASAATGFRSGGLSTGAPGGEYASYDPEFLRAYEAGLNWRSRQRRFDLRSGAFVYDYHDMQVRSTVLIDTALRSVVDNAARARLQGLEFSSAIILGGGWSANAGAVWLDRREFVEFTSQLSGEDLSGNTLSRAPALTATLALAYERPVREAGNFSLRLGYNQRSSFFFTKENETWSLQQGFGLLNVSAQFEANDGRWHWFASGRNLTAEKYFNQVFLQSSPGRPRTLETGFGWRF